MKNDARAVAIYRVLQSIDLFKPGTIPAQPISLIAAMLDAIDVVEAERAD